MMGSMASLSAQRPALHSVLRRCQQSAASTTRWDVPSQCQGMFRYLLTPSKQNHSKCSVLGSAALQAHLKESFLGNNARLLHTSNQNAASRRLNREEIRTAAVAETEQLGAAVPGGELDPLPLAEGLVWTNRTHSCGQLTSADVGKTVRLCGWVAQQRSHGGVAFVNLRDHTGIIQV
jgi:hypothetical protein